MVEANPIGGGDNSRQIYRFQKVQDKKDKCTSLEAYDQIVVLGVNPTKGFVCPLIKDSSIPNEVSQSLKR